MIEQIALYLASWLFLFTIGKGAIALIYRLPRFKALRTFLADRP